MSLFDVLKMLGGLALFLFGMSVMGQGLEKSAGGKLKSVLEKLTSSPLKGFLLGLGVTAVIQSSSATTVMVVGFVNSGVMKLRQAIGIIMGANVGTTVTSWMLSLASIEGDSLIINLLKPSSFSPVLAVIGVILYMFAKSGKKKDVGSILLGFAVLMFGMETMSGAVAGLKNVPAFTNILVMFSNPVMGVLAGALITAVIQSSSASVGILQALSSTGAVTFASAVPIILGQNIGTCVTALLSSVGTNKNARRAALVHLYFNVIGVSIFLILFYVCRSVFDMSFLNQAVDGFGIAVVHTIFNVLCTCVMLPFSGLLEKLAYMTIKDEDVKDEFQLLDERLLVTPSIAIEQCKNITVIMAGEAKEAVNLSISLVNKYSEDSAERIIQLEEKADIYEDKLGSYLVALSSKSLTMDDSREVARFLHTISDFERITDHAKSILISARKINDNKKAFSDEAMEEFKVVSGAVGKVVDMTVESFAGDDSGIAKKVEPLEQVVDGLCDTLRDRHIDRLQRGVCTVEQGVIFTDLLTDYRRISDHCSNIAACVIEMQHGLYNPHEYLDDVRANNSEFADMYKNFALEYHL